MIRKHFEYVNKLDKACLCRLHSEKRQVIVRVARDYRFCDNEIKKKKKAHKLLLYKLQYHTAAEKNKYKLHRRAWNVYPNENTHTYNDDTTALAPNRQSSLGDCIQHVTVDQLCIYIYIYIYIYI